jgi:hypothetical protein
MYEYVRIMFIRAIVHRIYCILCTNVRDVYIDSVRDSKLIGDLLVSCMNNVTILQIYRNQKLHFTSVNRV